MNYEEMSRIVKYDEITGEIYWAERSPWRRMGVQAGTVGNGRRKIMISGRQYHAHRIAWLLVHREWPKGDIDHIDGNPLNNAIANLRDVSRSVNMQNLKRARSDSKTGKLGTIEKNGRFRACIRVSGKTRHLGYFDDVESAHSAYLAAKRQSHEGCTL